MKKKPPVDFIHFAVKQAKAAQKFGFRRNVCCRNLKITIEHYWRKDHLGIRQKEQMKEQKMCSKKAAKKPLSECEIEHAVPMMVLVNILMDKKDLTNRDIIKTLKNYFRVLLITKEEHRLLNSSGLTSAMPKDWDRKDTWARYTAVGIELNTAEGAAPKKGQP